jgi:hypothetical protein
MKNVSKHGREISSLIVDSADLLQVKLFAHSMYCREIVSHKRQENPIPAEIYRNLREHHYIYAGQYYNAISKILLSPHHGTIQTLPKRKRKKGHACRSNTQKQASVCSHAYLYVAATGEILQSPATYSPPSARDRLLDCMWIICFHD